ncbi:Reticulon-3-A [Galdieria sulphuraria]|nr:Reticulon-3-A [Galdieria sulphuraria]
MADPESESSSFNHSANQPTSSSPTVDDLLGGQSPSTDDQLTKRVSAKGSSDIFGEYSTTSSAPKMTPIPLAPSFISGRAAELIYWRNMFVSTVVFVVGNIFFLAITVGKKTLFVGFLGPDFVGTPTLGKPYVTKESLSKYLETSSQLINSSIDQVKIALFCVDNMFTLKLLAFFYFLSLLGRLISTSTLGYLVFLYTFTVPVIYEHFNKEIDEFVVLVKTRIYEVVKPLRQKVQQHLKQLTDRCPPRIRPHLQRALGMNVKVE